jgi:hypothetical protein
VEVRPRLFPSIQILMKPFAFIRVAASCFALLISTFTLSAQTFGGLNLPGASSDFNFTIDGTVTNISVIVPGSATAYSDVLLKRGTPPTDTSYDYISKLTSTTNSIHLEAPELSPGTYFIKVRTPSGSATHSFSLQLQKNLSDMRSATRPVSKPLGSLVNSIISANGRQYFKLDLATNTSVKITIDGTNAAPDLYIQRGQVPTDTVYLKRSVSAPSDSIVMLDTEALAGTYYIAAFSPSGGPANLPFTLSIAPNPIQTLSWDPGTTFDGTLISSNLTGRAGDYYFKITTANPSLGAWRTALKVLDGEANLYLSRGVLPTTGQADYRSERTGSDGFVLGSTQFAPNEVWYVLVKAAVNAKWMLVSGSPYVQDLGTIAPDGSSGSGEVIMGPEGIRFFSATVPTDMLAWRLWLNGATNSIFVKKVSLPLPSPSTANEGIQAGQMLVVPPYLTGGQQYFIGVAAAPGTTNNLDSRYQVVTDLAYGSSTTNIVTGFPYTTYRVQVPPQQIAWQISIPSTNGNPNVAVRRNTVPNENYNDALSELATSVTDNIALVPPVLSDGTFYVTVWGTGPHQFGLQNGPAAVTDINYVDTIVNDETNRVGWRYFRVTDINQQLGSLGWELTVTNAAPGTRIAIRRNAAPSTWTFRNPLQATATYLDLISPGPVLQHPGHQADVWYVGVYNPTTPLGKFTLVTKEIQATPLVDNVGHVRTNSPSGLWEFYKISVPATANGNPVLGWDLRMTNVTGNPVMVIRRDALPDAFSTSFSLPISVTNWPTRSSWMAAGDWTGRSNPNTGTTNENGRIIAAAMGKPLEPGTYYIGVQSSTTFPGPASYTLISRWIGVNQAISIQNLNFTGSKSTNSVGPRFANYYQIDVPPNKRSLKLHLKTLTGEAMLVANQGTLPNITAQSNGTLGITAGKTVQKKEDEYLNILPPRGSTVLVPGSYYIGVIGEGQNPPDNSHIGLGDSSYVLETLGEMPELDLGSLGETNIVTTGTLPGGDSIAYHFTPQADILGFWITVEDRVGNPVAVEHDTVELADPGLSGDVYGNDGGQTSQAISGIYIVVANARTTQTIMIKARQSGGTGVFEDASYTLKITAIRPQPLTFDGGLASRSNVDPLQGSYFYVDVPPDALGWDVRLKDVTSGNPGIAITRDILPIALTTTTGFTPATATNWVPGNRWAATRDWTERSESADGVDEDARILAMGKGRPLEPGRYYVSVLGRFTTEPMSFTLTSRGIGGSYSIPVTPLNYNGGTATKTGLAPREAAYFSVTVPPNSPTLKVKLAITGGEALLAAAKDTIPNVLVTPNGSLTNSTGRKMQKAGDEYFLLLPPTGASSVLPATYYLAVVGEGNSPLPDQIGLGDSDFTITSIGAAPIKNLGQLGFTDLLETNSIAGGDTQIYQFQVPAGTLGVEARLENRVGNPVMVLRQGPLMPDAGASGSGVTLETYGHDAGENLNNFVHPSLINVANPTNTIFTLIVMARSTSGTFQNASYTLRLNASGSIGLNFDDDTSTIPSQAAQTWKYFRVVVPTNALGWDLRLLNVTSGVPRLVIRREGLPNSVSTTPWSTPGSATSWPTNAQWAPGPDWTRRSQSFESSTISEDGRVFAVGMGRPLEPGVYFIGVYNNNTTGTSTSYTIQSRGIGPAFSIPLIDVPFEGSASGTLLPREAAYFRVNVPSNTPSWKVKLTGVSGESMLVALRGAVPNIDMNSAIGTLANGKGMQKLGNEHFVLLPATGQTNIAAGTNYFAVVSEGVNPPANTRIGNGSSSFTFESQGSLSTNDLGLLTSEDILYPDTVEGGEVKLYRFVIPSGMLGFKVRLENRVGNPTFVLNQSDKTPDPGAGVPSSDRYGNEGGYASTDGSSTLYSIPNPIPGVYSLVVKGRASGANYTDASYTLRLQEMLVPEINFSSDQNTNGLSNTISGILDDNERVFYKFTIPATNNGQAVVGWKLDLVQTSGLASMRVRRDILPADSASATEMPFTTAQAIIVPPFLTNGTWYVEVKGSGSTAFTLTSNPLLLERPVWIMPAPGETNQTLGVTAPLFGDTGIDTNGVPFSDPNTFLQQGFLHYYAVLVPETNYGVLRAALEAISGNPDLYLRYGAPPTLYHNSVGATGSIYDRSMLANATEYANWVPIDGKAEIKLKPGLWYMAVRAGSNANARYRLKLSVGSITELALNGPDLTSQLVAGGDWKYYRFTAPSTFPGGVSMTFSQQSGDVIVQMRDTVPPGNGNTGSNSDIKDWNTDNKNAGLYQSFDAPGTYAFNVPPLRPGAVYYFGVRAVSDSSFSIRAVTNGVPNFEPGIIDFYGGLAVTNLAPGSQAIYRIDVPAEATRWKHAATHVAGIYIGIEQGTLPKAGSEDYKNSLSSVNSSLNQYLLTGWPWVPSQSYFLVLSNTTAQLQEVVFSMDGRNTVTDDNDNDALPDSWELQYFGNLTSQSSAGDPDKDGVTNYDEYLEGTAPSDSGSFRARLITAASNGTILRTPDSASYDLNSQVTLTASPAPGYAFISWSGDASGRSNPLGLTMDAHKTIGAIFKLNGDDFVTAVPLVGNSVTASGSNVGMSKETGEPNHAGNPGGKSMWFRWTAPGSGPVTITTSGSGFDTVLAVYTGSTITGLTGVASDHNSGGLTDRSIVHFSATAGTTYNIAVDGYNGASSRITLGLSLQSTTAFPPEFDSVTRLLDGRTQVVITGDPNHAYSLEATADFVTWIPLGPVTTDAAGTGRFTDNDAPTLKKRFYRTKD